MNPIARIAGGVVVSVQAGLDSPLHPSEVIAAMAGSAAAGGAAGFRLDGPANIAAVRAGFDLPIIGIRKRRHPGYDVYITATVDDAREIVEAGADLVAVDATLRPRPVPLAGLIAAIHDELGAAVLADVATADEGLAAMEAGADLVATTMAGYTPYSTDKSGPAFAVCEALAGRSVPVVVEGRIWSADDVRRSFDAGAHAVVVGTAVTSPHHITARLVAASSAGVPA
ncbi:N-acetylmannosamine-6-phosphate 2-epimerase [Microbispora sp. CA-102843]|uniref:N-acetylmannosamine-6-phosphate 2-epimerase n=1 Tax=Microbispora sp. CA-102843 TaxID=3239952 RepID=UPI003D9091C2